MFPLGHLGLAAAAAWILGRRQPTFDLRPVLLGAVLPDLLDKPLGALLGLESRLWGHTGLFALALAAAAIAAVQRSPSAPWVAFGNGVHLVLDRMWEQPQVLAWPAFGLAFPPGSLDLFHLLEVLITDPYVYGGELIGAVLLVVVLRRHGVRDLGTLQGFLRSGHGR